MSLPEVYDKTAEQNNYAAFVCVRSSMAERMWADQHSFCRELNCMSNLFHWAKEMYCRLTTRNQLNMVTLSQIVKLNGLGQPNPKALR
jgi:hypothetical protein